MAQADHAYPLVSIVLAVRNESFHIRNTIESLLQQDYPAEKIEILVVDGRSDDDSREQIEALISEHANIRLLDNPDRITPAAFNVGIRAAKGEIVAIFGAHADYDRNYLSSSVRALQSRGVVCAGGPAHTIAHSDRYVAQAIQHVLTHPLARGRAEYRDLLKKDTPTGGVCYPVWRREVFQRHGLYDLRMLRSQDNEFNARVTEQGEEMLLVADTAARMRARASIGGLARWAWNYGKYHVPLFRVRPSAVRLSYSLPLAFVGLLLGWFVASLFWPAGWWAVAGLGGGYALAVLAASVHVAVARRGAWRYLPILPVLFVVFHFCYGFGTGFGLFRYGWSRRFARMAPPRLQDAAAASEGDA